MRCITLWFHAAGSRDGSPQPTYRAPTTARLLVGSAVLGTLAFVASSSNLVELILPELRERLLYRRRRWVP